jgi:hypothetical protein
MGLAERHGISAFDLFCAYHLGITDDGGYRFQNVHDVAKRFGTSSAVIKQLLAELGMDADAIIHSSFDMASAQVDVMSAPEGISRRELARQLFEEFQKAPRRARNWAKELAEDARENERTYGAIGATRGSGAPRSPDREIPGGSPAGRGTRRGPRS